MPANQPQESQVTKGQVMGARLNTCPKLKPNKRKRHVLHVVGKTTTVVAWPLKPTSQSGKKCKTCRKKGHFASVCKSKSKAAAGKPDEDSIGEDDALTHFFAMHAPHNDQPKSDFWVCPMSTLDFTRAKQLRKARQRKQKAHFIAKQHRRELRRRKGICC